MHLRERFTHFHEVRLLNLIRYDPNFKSIKEHQTLLDKISLENR